MSYALNLQKWKQEVSSYMSQEKIEELEVGVHLEHIHNEVFNEYIQEVKFLRALRSKERMTSFEYAIEREQLVARLSKVLDFIENMAKPEKVYGL